MAPGKKLGVNAIVFSQLFNFGDRPDWRVEREAWRFVYYEQMLGLLANSCANFARPSSSWAADWIAAAE